MTAIERALNAILKSANWLALPIALLLFLQWPLREYIQAWSREVNDLGQCLFALFVTAGVVAATRAREHIATDAVASRFSPRVRSMVLRLSIVLALLPWALFVLWAGAPLIAQSVRLAERFPDTANPGYFMIKVALGLMMVVIIAQALVDLVRGDRS